MVSAGDITIYARAEMSHLRFPLGYIPVDTDSESFRNEFGVEMTFLIRLMNCVQVTSRLALAWRDVRFVFPWELFPSILSLTLLSISHTHYLSRALTLTLTLTLTHTHSHSHSHTHTHNHR